MEEISLRSRHDLVEFAARFSTSHRDWRDLAWEFCWSSWNFALSFSRWSRLTYELLNGHQLSKKDTFQIWLCRGFSSLFPSSNAGDRQTSSRNYSRQDRSLSPVIGCIKSHGVKYMPSFDRRVRFTVLPVGICLLGPVQMPYFTWAESNSMN